MSGAVAGWPGTHATISPTSPPVLLRTYVGNESQRMAAYRQEAEYMAQGGYYPVAQTYVPGTWGAGAYLLGLVAILFFGFGLLSSMQVNEMKDFWYGKVEVWIALCPARSLEPSCATGEVTQQELLLRMREGDQLVAPEMFLYIAERHGLGPSIDRWVIHAAVELAAARTSGDQPLLEVNLSGDSLGDPDLPTFIAAELRDHHVDPQELVFEVTETAAIENMDVARNFVSQISDLGCGFALDDFGAGFGSFYYLKYLPFDYIKIDGEFIRQLPANPADRLIVTAIVTAAHGLGKRTIAEYVGDRQTVALLRELGVDFAQGHFIGRPLPMPAPGVHVPLPRSEPTPQTHHAR